HPLGSEVYYIEEGAGPTAVPLDGGAARHLRTVSTQGKWLALADGGVLATEYAKDYVYMCPYAGCGDGGVILATDQPSPMGITHDATFIYWANEGSAGAGGTIMRLAK